MTQAARVYVRQSRFYVVYYAAGKRHRLATQIVADLPEPADHQKRPEWWRQSSHAAELESFVKEATRHRDGLRKKHQRDKLHRRRAYIDDLLDPLPVLPEAPKRLEDLLMLMIAERERKAGTLSPGTIDRRKNAVKMLRQFDPNFTYDSIDEEWLGEFRKWAESKFAASTLTGYLTDLRALADYGIKRGHLTVTTRNEANNIIEVKLAENKFAEIVFRQPQIVVRKTPKADEDQVLRFLWAENRPLFFQVMFQRLTGFRVTWVADLERQEINRRAGRITSLNRKAQRIEDFPIIEPLAWLLDELKKDYDGAYGKYLFKHRNRSTVYYYLTKACEYAGVRAYGTHQLKKNYTSEWRRYTGDPDVVNFLAHHAPSGPTKVSAVHYVDPDEIYEIAKETLQRAQCDRWLPFFKSLKKVKPSGKSYQWSNEKGHWKNRRSHVADEADKQEDIVPRPRASAKRTANGQPQIAATH